MPNWVKKYKDKDKARELRNKERLQYYAKSKENAVNRGTRYTQYEIDMILNHEITDHEISKIIGRSVQAIQNKRSALINGRA